MEKPNMVGQNYCTMSNADSIEIRTPEELYEHLNFLEPNISVEFRHDEGDNPTIKLRLKRYDRYSESDEKRGIYTGG